MLKAWIERDGVPQALYTDWKNVYVRVPNAGERRRGEVPVTQFGRMRQALGIEIWAAPFTPGERASGEESRDASGPFGEEAAAESSRVVSTTAPMAGSPWLLSFAMCSRNRLPRDSS